MSTDARDEPHFNALPIGTRFGELEILDVLGIGGFGIVYLARDHSLEREVAIKEYMPSQFAKRDGQSHVSVRSVSMQDTFEVGRRSFVNEARLLARFDHPSLLKVYRFWEANGTAYMAMPRLVGQNLREARRNQPTPPPEAWARRVFDAVLGGLTILHAQQVWHRDIAPDNIFLPADGGPPILLDFGAARQAIGDRTQVFTAILKPSYAPIEQYSEATTLRQGPWTDFYALAAAMHDLLTGRPPPPATARAMGDELAPLQVAGYSPGFLAALDWALRLPPQQRPQTAAAWREVVDGHAGVPAAQPGPGRAGAPGPVSPLDLELDDAPAPNPVPTPAPTTQRTAPPADDDDGATVVVPQRRPLPPPPSAQPVQPAASKPAEAPAPRARGWQGPALAGGGVAALLLVGWVWMQSGGKPSEPQAQRVPEPAASAPGPAALAQSEVRPQAASAPQPPPEVKAQLQAASAPAPAPAPAPRVIAKPAAAPAASSASPRPALQQAGAASAARRDPAPRPMVTEKAGDYRPMARSPVLPTPEPPASSGAVTHAGNSAANNATKAAQESAPPPSSEPKTANEACGGRVLFARAWCMDRQCEKAIYKDDPECVRLRDIRNSRANH